VKNQEILDSFLRFSNQLTDFAVRDPLVIGLVFLGSAADHARVDEWSDHDFYLVVETGFGEQFRLDLSWLPNSENIALSPRETEHGLKVVYTDGHVLEFAVFEDSQLELASANSWAVTVDKSNISERMSAIEAKSRPSSAADWDTEFDLFLAQLVIGIGRYRRGEILTASQFLSSYLVGRLVRLTRLALAPVPGSENLTDSLDVFRRFEAQYPSIARRIEAALQNNLETCGQKLLETLEVIRPVSNSEKTKIAVVRSRLGWQN
jgi:hypothetical protein